MSSGIFAAYIPQARDWAVGYDTARAIKNHDWWTCDHKLVINSQTKQFTEYVSCYRIIARRVTFKANGYIEKTGIPCFDDKHYFSPDASSVVSLTIG
ncbi:hypothetical protein [Hyperthermus butylicus]|uniref:hypothetical protein n=1 Tax=Hyperthermus butylicus TaxID=54248 RepID=UPI00032694BC|nr:hypothetical protein [Hyperthermus butylicus]